MEKTEVGLAELKKEYEKIQKKYGLPSFKEMNEDFHIEKISENETELLLAEVRRFMWEKFSNYMRLLEGILNPANASMFIFSVIKMLNPEDKKELSEIYQGLMKEEVKIIMLDLYFNEAKEAEFIKNSHEIWQKMKKKLGHIFEKIEKGAETKAETGNKDYFG